ncbi:MAG: hypothetical protein MZV63_04425 [Marinilabiliales bacterium]|nr:hypothetical protein [Marinilabiliales bacterium]
MYDKCLLEHLGKIWHFSMIVVNQLHLAVMLKVQRYVPAYSGSPRVPSRCVLQHSSSLKLHHVVDTVTGGDDICQVTFVKLLLAARNDGPVMSS